MIKHIDQHIAAVSAFKTFAELRTSMTEHGYVPTLNYVDGNVEWNNSVEQVIRCIIKAGGKVFHKGSIIDELPRKRVSKIKASTVQKRIAEMMSLYNREAEMIADSEHNYGYVTPKVEEAVDKLEARQDKLRDETIARLVESGIIASEDGVTAEEADQPYFDDINGLWELGDGWC